MEMLSHHPRTCVCGYNVSKIGGFFAGTLSGFPEDRIHELPLAESSMTGIAIGMSLDGWIPILAFERMDFVLLALDQIVNTLDKLALLSNGLHKPAVIIRCVVGNSQGPLFTGPTHCQDFSKAIREMVSFPVVQLKWPAQIVLEYSKALDAALSGRSTMLVEEKDSWNQTV